MYIRKAKVLNYARKNKYPRNCITLTYWGNDYSSRLDLDKDKCEDSVMYDSSDDCGGPAYSGMQTQYFIILL